ncbi:MAG: pilin [Candidatus Peregrinibacteria bacterium]|nr:pilin [Candidatus Peregrinibacteria bacterium]
MKSLSLALLPLLVAVVLPSSVLAQIDAANPQLIPESGIVPGTTGVVPAVPGKTALPTNLNRAVNCNFVTGEFDFGCIPLYLAYLLQVLFGVIGTVCVIEIIWAGYQIALSGVTGDKEKGKARLTWALIGFVIAILAFLIIDLFVTALIGVS